MTSQVLKYLNPEQLKAVTTTEGPLLIIAGAGTGKTTVITHRIAYIIEKKLAEPSEILALTFTDKASEEMERRVDILVPYGFIDTWISTFHAFGDRVLRDNALEMGLNPVFRVLTKPEQILFVKQNLFDFNLNHYKPLSNPYKFIEAALSLVSRAKDEDLTPDQYMAYATSLKDEEERQRQLELANFFAKYEELKRKAGLADFSDQINLVLDLFRRHPKVLETYQNKFKYILIDEYQDTNYAQNEFVKLLAAKHKNVCVVGDDDQSIYKFRGAAISNILEFKKIYPKAIQVVLTKNYRSTQPILDAAYKLISHNNPDRLEIKNKINKKLISERKEPGQEPKNIFGATLSEETDIVAQEINALVKDKKIMYRDIAILLRANSSARPFIQALNILSIPSTFVGSFGLYDREEIKSLIAFLRALSTFDDNLNLYYLATSELYNIPPEDMIVLNDFSRRTNLSLYKIITGSNIDEMEISDDSKIALEKLKSDLETYVKLSLKQNAGKTLYAYLEESGYLKKLKEEDPEDTQGKIANIAKFFKRISEFDEVTNDQSTINFSNFLEVMQESGENPSTAQIDPDLDAVNIMSIHSAKGLEYKVIFLVSLVTDKFPVRDRSEPIPLPDSLIKESLPSGNFHIQEERRLFYVGLTRAKDFLYLTYARDYGGKKTRKVSPFVLETLDVTQVEGMPQKSSAIEQIERFKPDNAAQMTLDFEKKTVSFQDRILDLSRIDVESYLSCALQYWYGHIVKLQVPRAFNLVYGIALHKAVEEFYRYRIRGQLLPLSDLITVLENAWVSEGFISSEHEKLVLTKARKVISDFYEREKSQDVDNVVVEEPFKFTHEKIIVRGRIDFLQRGDRVRLIDFKSTENVDEKKGTNHVKQSIQLKIYTLYYFKKYGKLPDEIGIYFLENGMISTIKPAQSIISEAISALEVTASGIRAGKFNANPKEGSFTCQFCSFKDICPFSLAKS
ncbi:MAG: ATP-dependent helicase [Candidatus Curtissbacteria bacterium]|nr:ATP-dependent helicase [Candidatus Curtissbacteria bacterium]